MQVICYEYLLANMVDFQEKLCPIFTFNLQENATQLMDTSFAIPFNW